MSKAILVLDDMPKDCWSCPLCYDTLCCILCENDYHEMSADDPCPLRPLPETIYHTAAWEIKQSWETGKSVEYLSAYQRGRNDCLDEIAGGKNE